VAHDLLITNVKTKGHAPGNVLIRNGRIASIGPTADVEADTPVLDGRGKVLMPSFVDAHSHLDKTTVGMPWHHWPAGRSLEAMLTDERNLRRSPEWDYERQISRNVEIMLAKGATYTRAFVDIDTEGKLRGFEAMLAMKEKYKNDLTMQIIAFPQSGVAARPGTAELVADALANGADIVGGIDPCMIERDPVRHLDWLFGLAEKHDAGVDVHLHEPGTMGAFSAELIIERTRITGLRGRVVISHPNFLGDIAEPHARKIIDDMAATGVAVTTNAPPSAKPPLRYMMQAGLTIGSGCDGARDSWAPMNRSDMLFKAYQLALHNGLTADEELDIVLELVTSGGAQVMAIKDYGLDIGSPADVVLLPGQVVVEPIVTLPVDRTVIKSGRVVARNGKYLLER
jgi:cytosine/creatinine deaminase